MENEKKLYVVWYQMKWVDFDVHIDKQLVGIFDTIEKAEKAKLEMEYEIFARDWDFDEKVFIESITLNEMQKIKH